MNEEQYRRRVEHAIGTAEPGATFLLLESQLRNHPWNRLSIFAADPDVILTARGTDLELSENGRVERFRLDPWEGLQQVRRSRPGWYLGYLGYDLKNHLESLASQNPDPTGAPDLLMFRPRTLWIYDHLAGRLLGPPPPGAEANRGAEAAQEGAEDSCAAAAQGGAEDSCAAAAQGGAEAAQGGAVLPGSRELEELSELPPFRLGELAADTPPGRYIDQIRRAQELIREGEVYEVNLSHLLRAPYDGHSYDLYRKMRSAGPVPFAGYLNHRQWSVCCSSPERFLRREGDRLFSQPIKGTAPRMDNVEADRAVSQLLKTSEKERAENLMIVDLVRHDLSRVSLPGTISVPGLFELQSFDTVHQLISTIEGRLPEGFDPVEAIKACFPMGSMTGAPKIRAMEIIDQLETYRRGIYSGAIGYLAPNGDFDLNVVIRSAIMDGQTLCYPVGGAITSDSEPDRELEETWFKARALRQAVEPEKESV